jgi:vancomycin permeability regulator SanA
MISSFLPHFRRRWWFRVTVGLAAVIGFAAIAIAVAGWCHTPVKSDVAIVLGTRVELDGTPSLAMRLRCDAAVKLYRDGLVLAIVSSGGTGKEGYDEAVVMRDYMVQQGVPTAAIHLDSVGVNTFASGQAARSLARQHGWQSIVAVSQYYHLPRTCMVLRRFGFKEVSGAYPSYIGWRDLYACPREVVGYLSYWWKAYPPL